MAKKKRNTVLLEIEGRYFSYFFEVDEGKLKELTESVASRYSVKESDRLHFALWKLAREGKEVSISSTDALDYGVIDDFVQKKLSWESWRELAQELEEAVQDTDLEESFGDKRLDQARKEFERAAHAYLRALRAKKRSRK